MKKVVAFPAKRDQIGLGVIAKDTAPLDVVNIQVP